MLRVGILASGEGTNFQALHDACATGYAHARIVVALTNRPDAGVLRRADRAGVDAAYVDPQEASSREGYDEMLLAHLRKHDVELVCGAGFLRILSPVFVDAYANRILNVHPSLLPAFPGLDANERAWDWGVKVTGVTVHLIDAELDHGPILYQRAVDVLPTDDLASLTARLHAVEYALYPKALRYWAECGGVRLDGRRVVIEREVPDPPWAGGPPPGLEGGV